MPRVIPFTGLTFDPEVVGPLDLVTAPPYDAIGERERRRYLAASPYNVVRLDLGDEGADEAKYRSAASLLRAWCDGGALRPSGDPVYYAYEMRFRLNRRERRIRGILCALELEDWGGRVVPHERTMPGPIKDRLCLLRATRTNLSALYGTISGPCLPLADLLADACAAHPAIATVDEQRVLHRLWEIPGQSPVAEWLGDERILIADGHHRYATALRFRDEMRREAGPGPWDHVLALVVDERTEEPPVLPIHRIVTAGKPPSQGRRARDLQELLAELDDRKLVYGIATRDRDELVHLVADLQGRPPTVRVLHDEVLAGLRPGTDVRFTPDADEAERAVRDEGAIAAYFLPPTSTDRIRAVIDRGERLPEKSTFFWPKPRTGMVIRPLEQRPPDLTPRAAPAS